MAAGMLAAHAQAPAQALSLRWGLDNDWSYYEPPAGRSENEDASYRPKEPKAKRYRAFAFKQGSPAVLEPWLACVNLVMQRYEPYARNAPKPAPGEDPRENYMKHLRQEAPACIGQFKKTAPRLYFDFTSAGTDEVVLEKVEVTTIRFSEYKGGGFAEREAWYDILLSHRPGTKVYLPEPRLVFTGHGRVVLRLWSDNFYPPPLGWVAPMGEYTLDIAFVFTAAGKSISVRTGPFKIDV
jgi:hypothetical protein